MTASMSFFAFPLMTNIDMLAPRKALLVAGANVHTRYYSEDVQAMAPSTVGLVIGPGADHVDLYDRKHLIPFDRFDAPRSIPGLTPGLVAGGSGLGATGLAYAGSPIWTIVVAVSVGFLCTVVTTIFPQDSADRLAWWKEYNGKIIPSGLFRQPEAAHLSGVLFSNAHTFPMFNRIGTELELGAPGVELVRVGTCFDPDPHAFEPQKFAYVVGDRPPGLHETFAEGLHLFINPWAQVPLSPAALPNIPFIAAEPDGHPVVNHPGRFQPYMSKTMTFDGMRADMFARYFAAWWMDLVPMIPSLFGSGPKTET